MYNELFKKYQHAKKSECSYTYLVLNTLADKLNAEKNNCRNISRLTK